MKAQLLPEVKTTTLSAKPHYAILDGLRGVAALTVVAFHLCEAHATSHLDQVINHGYLAVDFFFLLSGFVIGYAYDDRWTRMTLKDFVKVRLIRLQPMVVLGMIIGGVFFYFQASSLWPTISQVPVWKMLLVMIIGFTLLPVPVSMDIRGWHEMHPLDGPAWSLFFEYIANLLYALGVRKFSNTALAVLVFLAGAALLHFTVTSPAGDVIGGWSLEPAQLRIGFTRLMFPFFAGLLLSRVANLGRVQNAFLWCSLLLLLVLAFPRVGGAEHVWLNGLYDSLSIILVFPLIVWLGASGQIFGKGAARLCTFLGDISYPIYITHYPLIYTYTAWVSARKHAVGQDFPLALLTFVASILLAYACLKFYDEPVRRWLKNKLLARA
ncbi:acyltransferase family protein [Hymenobacter cavernae]|uniref:Acyltransferase n=1 Tax=Hymenobacter cavernae TaxID=2044852 RepID=A0ABQ1UB21_9BACT|nr:acyltransferase [Hymenobacter cavernae]GGF12233.1 acyltransferase [Hymenobacter cavernae]